jgi:hypothetical protein
VTSPVGQRLLEDIGRLRLTSTTTVSTGIVVLGYAPS